MTAKTNSNLPPTIHKKNLARHFCLKFLFSSGLEFPRKEDFEKKLLDFIPSYTEKDHEHPYNLYDEKIQKTALEFLRLLALRQENIYEILEKNCLKRKFHKTDKITKCILALGTCELLYTETPTKVILNEYINLSKLYADKNSFSLVNAVLDKVAEQNRKTEGL